MFLFSLPFLIMCYYLVVRNYRIIFFYPNFLITIGVDYKIIEKNPKYRRQYSICFDPLRYDGTQRPTFFLQDFYFLN